MVHALKEAWRVLVPKGMMIDVRPLSVDVPLEVATTNGKEQAGMVDLSPGLQYDDAADQAIEQVLTEGLYSQLSNETFDFVYCWHTYHGMVVDFEERWEGEIIVAKEVLENARQLYRRKLPGTRLLLPMKMKLTIYTKMG